MVASNGQRPQKRRPLETEFGLQAAATQIDRRAGAKSLGPLSFFSLSHFYEKLA
jgi:hypothetical protein